jgi:hypothetical protein
LRGQIGDASVRELTPGQREALNLPCRFQTWMVNAFSWAQSDLQFEERDVDDVALSRFCERLLSLVNPGQPSNQSDLDRSVHRRDGAV